MPVFNKDDVPPEFNDDILKTLNEMIDRFRSALVPSVELRDPELGIRTPNLIRCYLLAHIWRIITFIDGGLSEHRAGRPLMADMAARAIKEDIACIVCFMDDIGPLLEAGDLEAVDKFVTNAAFATRVPDWIKEHGREVEAQNILKAIDKMTKVLREYRSGYDRLSDIVHPNGLGATIYFSQIEESVAHFGVSERASNSAMNSLATASLGLIIVQRSIQETEERIERFRELLKAQQEE
jgi:hypothetical protein